VIRISSLNVLRGPRKPMLQTQYLGNAHVARAGFPVPSGRRQSSVDHFSSRSPTDFAPFTTLIPIPYSSIFQRLSRTATIPPSLCGPPFQSDGAGKAGTQCERTKASGTAIDDSRTTWARCRP